MLRCLELARRGRNLVAPNPMVGCVIAKGSRPIAEGYHRRFGGAHAEVHALRRARGAARGATLYVNLEPCSHQGKTPPCVDAIIAAGIKRVVVADVDPNPVVHGRGLARLRAAGIRVKSGVLRGEARALNRRFYISMKKKRPFVGVKIAETLDGRIADSRGRSRWITSQQSRKHGHAIRAQYDAVLVGAKTVTQDNPRLTVRFVRGKSPVRIVLDGALSVSPRARIFNASEARTILLTSSQAAKKHHGKVVKLLRTGVEVIAVSEGMKLNPATVLRVLASMDISSVLIEGGSYVVSRFAEEKLVDRIHCFVAPKILGGGLQSVEFWRALSLSHSLDLHSVDIKRFGDDIYIEGDTTSR